MKPAGWLRVARVGAARGTGRVRRALFPVALALALAAAPVAQFTPGAPPPPPTPVLAPPPDTDPRTPRALAPDALDAYRADPAFAYGRPRAEQPSLWQRLLRWLGETIFDPVARSGDRLWTPLLLLVAALVVAWGVARALRADGSRLFAPRDADVPDASDALLLDTDDIGSVDLDARLARALAADDFREATRLRYLRLLQRLDVRGAIAWRRSATNRDYLWQVRAARPGPFARDFAAATRAFAFVWYGRAPLDAARFARLAARFDALDEALDEALAPSRAALRTDGVPA